jgi:predicted P-loop ATPase
LKALLGSDFAQRYNPIKDYIQSLRWDGEDHISQLAKKVHTDDDLFFTVAIKKYLLSAVASWLYEGHYNEHILLLNGGQGVGKSTFASELIPPSLRSYKFQGSILNNTNDFLKYLSRKMFIILDEFDSIAGRFVPLIKEFVTRATVETRLPYHKYDINERRIASFMTTTNVSQPLRDKSGNRRYLCFTIIKMNWEMQVDIDQVYAQCYDLLKRDPDSYRFTGDELIKIKTRNERFTYFDMIEEAIAQRYEPTLEQDADRKSAREITKEILSDAGFSKITNSILTRVGITLNNMGFKKGKSKGSVYYLVRKVSNKPAHEKISTSNID